MIDPYLYFGTSVLKNKLGIIEQSNLDIAEASYIPMRLKELKDKPLLGSYDFKHLCNIHKYIFQDIYDWAGKTRILDIIKHEAVLGGLSIDYAKHGEIKKEAIMVIRRMKDESWPKHKDYIVKESNMLARARIKPAATSVWEMRVIATVAARNTTRDTLFREHTLVQWIAPKEKHRQARPRGFSFGARHCINPPQ